jgi:hypothetical protein
MGWPPRVGELLPNAGAAAGVRYKLATYSLNVAHESGGAKARGFDLILGITIESIDYLEAQIYSGIRKSPVVVVRPNPLFGANCAVDLPLRGIGAKRARVVTLRTAWLLERVESPPRLPSAYLRP